MNKYQSTRFILWIIILAITTVAGINKTIGWVAMGVNLVAVSAFGFCIIVLASLYFTGYERRPSKPYGKRRTQANRVLAITTIGLLALISGTTYLAWFTSEQSEMIEKEVAVLSIFSSLVVTLGFALTYVHEWKFKVKAEKKARQKPRTDGLPNVQVAEPTLGQKIEADIERKLASVTYEPYQERDDGVV